jgi:Transposase DDE domain group 1
MSIPPASLFDFDFFEPLPIQIEVSDAPLRSDAGLLPLRQFDERIGLTKQFAAVLDDPRDLDLIEHSFPNMVRMRIFGILAGYEDQNDHDTLRTDAVLKLIAGRQYQYLPLMITSAEPEQVVMVSLRHGTAPASLGADDDLEYLVKRVRAVWPNVRIRARTRSVWWWGSCRASRTTRRCTYSAPRRNW